MPHLLSALLYALLAIYFWRSSWQTQSLHPAAELSGGANTTTSRRAQWESGLLAIPLCLQGWGLYAAIYRADGTYFSFALALALMMWLAVLIYWLENFRVRMNGLQALVLPLAAISAVLPALVEARYIVHANTFKFQIHLLSAMLAYSLFALAAIHAVFMGLSERALHGSPANRHFAHLITSLPPLLSMEAVLFRMLWIGFVLLTISLGTGILFAEEVFGRALRFDHKTVFAFISWGIFAVLLAGRHFYGWRGRQALRLTLAGFLALMLAYIGTRFVLEVILGRV